jgi:DNA (cytosine-5)-methyltransferase 1
MAATAGEEPPTRSYRAALTKAYRWLLARLGLRCVLVENVPGLLAGHGGMGDVLGDLARLGYDAEWDSVPASAVGAPHLRYRVWIVAHAHDVGGLGLGGLFDGFRPALGHDSDGRGGAVPNPDDGGWDGRSGERGPGWGREPSDGRRWATEPDVGRVAHGVPGRVDRLRALGNAVVPQVVEVIGRQLLAAIEDRAA